MTKGLVLISENFDDIAFFQRVASEVGAAFVHQKNWEQLSLLPPQSLVLWNIEVLEEKSPTDLQAILKPITALPLSPGSLVTMASSLLSERPLTWQALLNGKLAPRTHFVLRPGDRKETLLKKCLSWMSDPLLPQKELSSAKDGLQIIFENSGQRSDACTKVQAYFQGLGVGARVASKLSQATDELLMNAIYDAAGPEARRQLTRDHVVHFSVNQRVQLHACATDQLLIVHARDFHGTLNDINALSHIHQHLKDGIYELKNDLPTAGLGLFELARTGISIFLTCQPGKMTDALIVVPRLDSLKLLRKESQFLHSRTC